MTHQKQLEKTINGRTLDSGVDDMSTIGRFSIAVKNSLVPGQT